MRTLKSNFICLFIENLKVDCIIGIYKREKVVAQPLVIEGKFYLKNENELPAKMTDALNYESLFEGIKKIARENNFLLIENLANAIIDFFFKYEQILSIYLKIYKQDLYGKTNVGVEAYQSKSLDQA